MFSDGSPLSIGYDTTLLVVIFQPKGSLTRWYVDIAASTFLWAILKKSRLRMLMNFLLQQIRQVVRLKSKLYTAVRISASQETTLTAGIRQGVGLMSCVQTVWRVSICGWSALFVRTMIRSLLCLKKTGPLQLISRNFTNSQLSLIIFGTEISYSIFHSIR